MRDPQRWYNLEMNGFSKMAKKMRKNLLSEGVKTTVTWKKLLKYILSTGVVLLV